MGVEVDKDGWLADILANGPKVGDYWILSDRFRNPPVVLLLSRDDQEFKLSSQTRPERMDGFQVESLHNGNRGFVPRRLLGAPVNAMQVLAWASK